MTVLKCKGTMAEHLLYLTKQIASKHEKQPAPYLPQAYYAIIIGIGPDTDFVYVLKSHILQ